MPFESKEVKRVEYGK